MKDVGGKVAFITGGSSGIGLGIAQAFEAAGMKGQASRIVHYEVDGCPIRMEKGLPYPANDYEGPSSLEILGIAPAGIYPPRMFSGSSEEEHSQLSQLAEEVFGNTQPETVDRLRHNHAIMSIYTNNGTVFCAGTVDWVYGLTGQDPAVERVTKNLLDRLSV